MQCLWCCNIQKYLIWNSSVSCKPVISSSSKLSFWGSVISVRQVTIFRVPAHFMYTFLIRLSCYTSVLNVGFVLCSFAHSYLQTSRGSTLTLILKPKGSHCWCVWTQAQLSSITFWLNSGCSLCAQEKCENVSGLFPEEKSLGLLFTLRPITCCYSALRGFQSSWMSGGFLITVYQRTMKRIVVCFGKNLLFTYSECYKCYSSRIRKEKGKSLFCFEISNAPSTSCMCVFVGTVAFSQRHHNHLFSHDKQFLPQISLTLFSGKTANKHT